MIAKPALRTCADGVLYFRSQPGIMSTGATIPSLAMVPLINYLLNLYNWRVTFRILAFAIGSVCFLAGLCFVQTEPEKSNLNSQDNSAGKISRVYKSLFKDPLVILWLIANFIFCLSYIVSHVHQVSTMILCGERKKITGGGGLLIGWRIMIFFMNVTLENLNNNVCYIPGIF